MLSTFFIISIAWVFFMSDSFRQAFGILSRVATHPFSGLSYSSYIPMLFACFLLLVLEWFQREKEYFSQIAKYPLIARWAIYYVSILVIIVFGAFGSTAFIYTQF